MKALNILSRFLARFRYPVSLPEDIASALGVHFSNAISFKDFVSKLSSPAFKPTTLSKFMLREQAEQLFFNAPRKEHFAESTLISYYFNEGWLEFVLKFDKEKRLRRLYLQHKTISQDEGIEIPLPRVDKEFLI